MMSKKLSRLAGSLPVLFSLMVILPELLFANVAHRIRSGEIATTSLIRSEHPRIWLLGSRAWNPDQIGSFAWRIVHGAQQDWPWIESSENDQHKFEFSYVAGADEPDSYGADNMYQNDSHDFDFRVLDPIIAGMAQKKGWQSQYQGSWTLGHSANEYLADARRKLLNLVDKEPRYEYPYLVALVGATAYDWLIDEISADCTPILSSADIQHIRDRLIVHGDHLLSKANGEGSPFDATKTTNHYYGFIGLALYEPSREGDAAYESIQTKAKAYLDAFDREVVGKVLPFWEAQGGDGGWHGGLARASLPFWTGGSYEQPDNVAPLSLAPLLFAHYTASGTSMKESLFNTGVLFYMPEFQLHLITPSRLDVSTGARYLSIGGSGGGTSRSPWILPMRAYTRRRFESDPEQQRIAELGAWVRVHFNKSFTDYGSWDSLEQLLFEDKWNNPRKPKELGFSTSRWFQDLGWLFMRSGFTRLDDRMALFICQPYHWSKLDAYDQNNLYIQYHGALLSGDMDAILVDGKGQRRLEDFPRINDTVSAYAKGSTWDVGPGIIAVEQTDDWTYACGDATNAYDSSILHSFTRQVLYIPPDRFVVMDRIVPRSPTSKVIWQINPGASPHSLGEDLISIEKGKGALWIKRCVPQTISVIQNSANRYAIQPQHQSDEVLFLHLMQITDSGLDHTDSRLSIQNVISSSEGSQQTLQWDDRKIILDSTKPERISVTSITAVDPAPSTDEGTPDSFQLLPGYPNPANPGIKIPYTLPRSADLTFTIYSVTGEIIWTNKTHMKAGRHQLNWEGRDLRGRRVPSGVYFITVNDGVSSCSQKLTVLR